MNSTYFGVNTNPDLMLTVLTTQSWRERARGLLALPKLRPSEALLISPCNMVHTFGMPYDIDLIFLNKQNRVVGISKNLKPRKIRLNYRASMVMEMVSGEVDRLGIDQSTFFLKHSF